MDDHELLREYVERHSEPAFTELVTRHLPLVYGTALRLMRKPVVAQDVAQTVFIQLACKASTLRDGPLAGWLYRATRHAALHALRHEKRRLHRETTAMNLAEQNHAPAVDSTALAPLLDEALDHLSRGEQDAVLLRFFEGRTAREIAAALSLSEEAAQKRVARALEKLRGHLQRRGLTVSAVALTATLDAGTVISVPVGLTAAVSATAITTATTVTGFSLTSLTTMITSKITLGIASAVVVAAFATILTTKNGLVPATAPQPGNKTVVAIPTDKASTLPDAAAKIEAPKQPPAPAGGTDTASTAEETPAVKHVNFLGEVTRPGTVEIPAAKGMTLASALATAGGPTAKADRYVTISRINPDGTTTILKSVDLLAAVKDGLDIALQEGDTITLGQSVAGNVWK